MTCECQALGIRPRPPAPEPVFLLNMLAVIEGSGHPIYKLGRLRETLAHRINRLEKPPFVLQELIRDCDCEYASRATWLGLIAPDPELVLSRVRNRICARLREAAA